MRIIEKVWFNGHQAKWLIVPVLLPFTLLFLMLTALRRWFYRVGIKAIVNTEIPVIVIGNIGIGGNGKTPLTIFLIELCKKLNIKVGVVSRGYGGSAPYTPYLLSDSSTAAEAGDEPLMIYSRCHVPVAVGPDRISSIKLLAQAGCQLALADDGLQHYRMARTSEILVVDGKRKFGNGLLLPAGPLREGVWRLSTVDTIVVNGHAQITDNQLNMALMPSAMVNMLTGESLSINDFLSRYECVNAIAAIGDPSRFFNTLNQCSIACQRTVGYVDHHPFSEQELLAYDDELPLVMTEKDAVKCRAFARENWWYLAVSAQFNQHEEAHFTAMLKSAANAK